MYKFSSPSLPPNPLSYNVTLRLSSVAERRLFYDLWAENEAILPFRGKEMSISNLLTQNASERKTWGKLTVQIKSFSANYFNGPGLATHSNIETCLNYKSTVCRQSWSANRRERGAQRWKMFLWAGVQCVWPYGIALCTEHEDRGRYVHTRLQMLDLAQKPSSSAWFFWLFRFFLPKGSPQ